MTAVYRYAELRPAQLTRRLELYPVAIAPWGALEWHGPHLPFGLDGLVAEAFSEKLAAQTGAILLPTTYLPITSLPHPQSISIRSENVRGVLRDLLEGLQGAGFRLICLVSGHYAQGHELILAEAAEELTRTGGPPVLAGTPLALLGDPSLLDHAGRWEASQLLALRPELVDLSALGEGALPPASRSAVLGEDPRGATAEQGEVILQRALAAWAGWMERLVHTADPSPLYELYAERRAAYQDYVERYFQGSWEAAIQAWWREKTG